MKVFQALAQAFAAEGVTDVFGMMGDANMFWIAELDKLGIPTYEVRHENAAVSMAHGYARVSGRVGVCTTTSGPGVTQIGTSAVIAARSSTPLVMFCGDSPTGDDDYVQRLDQRRFAEAVEAGFVDVAKPELALEGVRKAFYRAMAESRPIMLSVAMDIQQMDIPDDIIEDYRPVSSEYQQPRVPAEKGALARAAELIAASTRPVILVGQGAVASGAGEAVRSLAERSGALIATTLMAKNFLNEDPFHVGISGTYGTRTSLELFQDADVVVAVGASLNNHTTAAGYLYPLAKFIHIDTKPNIMMGGSRTADVYIQADGRTAVAALDDVLADKGLKNAGYRTDDVSERLRTAYDDPREFEITPGTVDARDVARALDKSVPAEIGMVLGSGANVMISTMLFNEPRAWILPNQNFGSIGQGITSTIGACVAHGKAPTFLVDGDYSVMMYLSEFETAVRYELPLLIVVMNDQAMGAEMHKLNSKGFDGALAHVTTPNLGEVARVLGGRGSLCRSVPEVQAAVNEFVAMPAPTIVDVRIARSVVSIPYRRLHFGEDA